MKKSRIFAIALVVAALIIPIGALSHPGKTDASGGHYNRSTGEYHYHHGYPEHQHINGQCPYNFDDKTGQRSGTSSSSKKSSPTPSPTPKPVVQKKKDDGIGIPHLLAAGAGGALITRTFRKRKEK